MRAAVKSVIMIVGNHGQMANMPYNVLDVRHTACVFLIWRMWARARSIACLSHPDLVYIVFIES